MPASCSESACLSRIGSPPITSSGLACAPPTRYARLITSIGFYLPGAKRALDLMLVSVRSFGHLISDRTLVLAARPSRVATVEDIEELPDWYLHRPVARRVVKLLLPTKVTPDEVTMWSGVAGVLASHRPCVWGRSPRASTGVGRAAAEIGRARLRGRPARASAKDDVAWRHRARYRHGCGREPGDAAGRNLGRLATTRDAVAVAAGAGRLCELRRPMFLFRRGQGALSRRSRPRLRVEQDGACRSNRA